MLIPEEALLGARREGAVLLAACRLQLSGPLLSQREVCCVREVQALAGVTRVQRLSEKGNVPAVCKELGPQEVLHDSRDTGRSSHAMRNYRTPKLSSIDEASHGNAYRSLASSHLGSSFEGLLPVSMTLVPVTLKTAFPRMVATCKDQPKIEVRSLHAMGHRLLVVSVLVPGKCSRSELHNNLWNIGKAKGSKSIAGARDF